MACLKATKLAMERFVQSSAIKPESVRYFARTTCFYPFFACFGLRCITSAHGLKRLVHDTYFHTGRWLVSVLQVSASDATEWACPTKTHLCALYRVVLTSLTHLPHTSPVCDCMYAFLSVYTCNPLGDMRTFNAFALNLFALSRIGAQ